MKRLIDFEAAALKLQACAVRGKQANGSALHLPYAASIAPTVQMGRAVLTVTPPRTVSRLPIDAPDRMIRRVAYENAALCNEAQMRAADDIDALAAVRNIAHAVGIAPPEAKLNAPIGPQIRRLCSSKWWRRRLRGNVARRTEWFHIVAGRVHRNAQCYVSDAGVFRRRQSALRNSELLDSMIAVNENGEAFLLSDLAEKTVSNPTNRRNELMTRIRGLEQWAKGEQWDCLFTTWTLPSRYHARLAASGEPNPKHDGSSARAGAREFTRQWKLVRSCLGKKKVRYAGLRVAEPHHDATPHWHLLVFCPRADRRTVMEVLRRYALKESPSEEGARRHRLKFKAITDAKGSAMGYIAKYVAKNVDGYRVGETIEHGADGKRRVVGEAAAGAERTCAWASHWGIRQFQFFGCPPITWWRELRRVQKVPPELEAAHAAADAGDYAAFLRECGGIAVKRALMLLATHKEPVLAPDGSSALNCYGEARVPVVKGVALASDEAIRVITRLHVWEILEPRQVAALPPWTCVNNCTGHNTLRLI